MHRSKDRCGRILTAKPWHRPHRAHMCSADFERVKRKCFREERHTGSCQSKTFFYIEPRKKGLELIGRRRGQDEANEAQSGEEETKTRPRRAEIGSTWGQDGAKTGQDGAKTGQDGTKMGQEWAKLDKSWRDWAEVGQKSCRSCRKNGKWPWGSGAGGPRAVSKWIKMSERDP